MKQTILRKLMLIALLLTGSHAFAYDFKVNDIYYNILSEEDKTVSVTWGDTYYSYNIVIRSEVTYNNISYNVRTIDRGAFAYCCDLTEVTIPNSVTDIGDEAFYGCVKLSSIVLPKSITWIGRNILGNCDCLTSIIVENGNLQYDSRDNCNAIIETATNTLLVGCKNTIIPNSVTSIGEYAFNDCTMNDINIPTSINSISNYAFFGCSNLTSVTIPNSVTSIGHYAFSSCSGLTNVIIPNSVATIGERAFCYCGRLTSIIIPNSVTSIGEWAFYECSCLTSIVVETGNTVYDSRDNCNAIIETATNTLIMGCEQTTIPNTIKNIGCYAFYSNPNLISITIPNSVINIGNNSFFWCTSLNEIICESTAPPTAESSTFTGVPTTATLYVPVGSKEAYASAEGWKNFTNIVEDDTKTRVESTLIDDVNVSIKNENIIICGTENVNVEVYNVNGSCIYNGTARIIPIVVKGLYIVKVNGKSHKVIL